ncbi:unnamed protein product [Prorocentrum cordatum]|uniref:Uncharacterized protein n=1 Tax=Prorocentrum cordatum TaxID=2364126 RepID=A0ABN9Y6K5_9DINO|nr:unnamed protein product [Polarella glacialis]
MQAPQRAAPEAWPGGKPLTLAELERWGGGGGGGGGAGRKAAAALHAAACGAVGSVAAGAGLPPRPTTGAAAAAGAGSAGQGAPLNDPVPPQGTAPVGTTACVSSWRYVDHIGAAVRAEPRIDGPRTEHAVAPGSIFGVSEERPGADGVLYLRLADGRGWLFDSVPGVGVLCARCADDGARAAPPGQAVEGDAPGDGEQCSGGGGQVADMPAFAPGDRVEYNSASLGWIPARVLQVNVDGTYNLDCKPWVRLERLRALAGQHARCHLAEAIPSLSSSAVAGSGMMQSRAVSLELFLSGTGMVIRVHTLAALQTSFSCSAFLRSVWVRLRLRHCLVQRSW